MVRDPIYLPCIPPRIAALMLALTAASLGISSAQTVLSSLDALVNITTACLLGMHSIIMVGDTLLLCATRA